MLSSSTIPKTAYTITASYFHWFVALPMIGCVGTVLKAQQSPKKEEKGIWMFRHKSLGLLTGMIVLPRISYRIFNSSMYNVRHIPGNAQWENTLGDITHYMLYGFMTIMPLTGIAMGYYGGKGLPFFYTTYKGSSQVNGNIAKQSFQIHKQIGTYGKYLIPAHASAAVLHVVRGQTIFMRINPFRTPRG